MFDEMTKLRKALVKEHKLACFRAEDVLLTARATFKERLSDAEQAEFDKRTETMKTLCTAITALDTLAEALAALDELEASQ